MGEHVGRMVRLCWKDGVGFGLFLAWVYCALFGCGLATSAPALNGTPAMLELEHIWQFNGIAEALGSAAGLVALALLARSKERNPRKGGGTWRPDRAIRVAALVLGIAASFVIWAAWLDRDLGFHRLYWIGGLLAGCATTLFTVAWGTRLSSTNEARIEFVVPLAFTVSFVLYLLLLLLKNSAVINLACAVIMCVGSCALLRSSVSTPSEKSDEDSCRSKAKPTARLAPCGRARFDSTSLRGLASFGALVCVSWVQIALYRVISSPALAGNRFTHYLYPFLMACVASCAMLVLCIFVSRYLNITLAFRWSMPLFVLSYVPLLIGYGNTVLRMAGYALNFLGMFGVQYGCWLGASKYVRRSHVAPAAVFCCLALGEGLGIAVGCAVGFVARELPLTQMLALALLLLAGVQLVTMAVGFNPAWALRRTRSHGAPSEQAESAERIGDAGAGKPAQTNAEGGAAKAERTAADAALPDPTALEELFHQQALWLQANFQLTNRETEVAELLLAGRSRPFIRDELYLSLNTVGVHVRSIFAKCAVHSQQELIDLGRNQGA